MRNYKIFIFIICILVNCSSAFSLEVMEQQMNRVSNQFSRTAVAQYGLEPFGSGGSMTSDIKEFIYSFDKIALLNVEQSRRLFINTYLLFKKTVDSDRKIRPLLREYPVTIQTLRLGIFLYSKRGVYASPPYICGVRVNNKETLCFFQYDSRIKDDVLFHEEPFDEAVKIVQRENNRSLLMGGAQ